VAQGPAIQTLMILGLAFIESSRLALFTLVIVFLRIELVSLWGQDFILPHPLVFYESFQGIFFPPITHPLFDHKGDL